jgi:glutamate-1-semialdehyde 2,1-aminomutase
MNKGTLTEISEFTLKFHYNDIGSLIDLFNKYPGQIAGVMLEPATTVAPVEEIESMGKNFLHRVKETAHTNGAIFILDEMITGFRWHLQGAQTYFNIEPDLCTFGKAMANGFAVAALGGKKKIMEMGGILQEGQERIFLTSTTHGAEMSALGAFIKTVEILKRDEVIEHFWTYGAKLMDGMNNIAEHLGLESNFVVEGFPCSPIFLTKDESGSNSLALRTLFAQEMATNGVLMPYLAISYAHQDLELSKTLEATTSALEVIKRALENGIEGYLNSPVIKPVFRKYN